MRYRMKRLLAELLSAVILLSLLPAMAWAAGFEGAASGNGTVDSPYEISTKEQLVKLRESVNGGTDFQNTYFELTADIDLDGGPDNQWTPIGNEDTQFKGTFDGGSHTVSGLYIKSGEKDLGLFGAIGQGGTVKNLGVSGSVTGENTGESYVGGIAGRNNGGTIENCYNAADISGHRYVGGIAGWSANGGNDQIRNCYNTGTIHGYADISGVGGIAGYLGSGFLRNSYNAGDIIADGNGHPIGGLVGNMLGGEGFAYNCYNVGNVIGEDPDYLGAFAGDGDGRFANSFYLEGTAPRGTGPYLGGDGRKDERTADVFRSLASELNSDGDVWEDDPFLGRPVLKTNREPWPISGSGTESDPYLIPDKETLEKVRDYINNSADGGKGKVFKLTNNIDLAGGPDNQWTPIGNSGSFQGTFDGDGYTISGLYIDQPSSSRVGLFSEIGNSATVKNLTVAGTVIGSSNVGGIVGMNSGTVENCHNLCDVNAANMIGGGVVGFNSGGTVANCHNSGDILGKTTGESQAIGGIVGANYFGGTVTNCYNTGKVTGDAVGGAIGGIVGTSGYSSTVKDCYNTGEVTGTARMVGAIVGSNSSTVTNCYYLENTADKGVGDGSGTGAAAKTAAQFRFLASALGEGWADSVAGRPVLLSNPEADIISADVPYEIPDKETLETFRDYVNSGKGSGEFFKLTADIDLEGNDDDQWTPIGSNRSPFQGTFDGNGHTISGLYINRPTQSNQGLFSQVGEGGTVKNLTVEGNVTGDFGVGGIVGQSDGGTIDNCHNAATVTASIEQAGGIVGFSNNGTVTNCYNTAAVTGSSQYIGGIVGQEVFGSVTNCYNTGKVTATGGSAGAIAGEGTDGTVTNCYYLSGTAASGFSYGDSAGTTAKTEAAFNSGEVAWLLQGEQGDQVWGQTVGSGYPELTGSAEKKVYQVTFRADLTPEYEKTLYANLGGTLPEAETLKPEKDGYTFVKWALTDSPEGKAFTASTPVNSDLTLYAIFEEKATEPTPTESKPTEPTDPSSPGTSSEPTESEPSKGPGASEGPQNPTGGPSGEGSNNHSNDTPKTGDEGQLSLWLALMLLSLAGAVLTAFTPFIRKKSPIGTNGRH